MVRRSDMFLFKSLKASEINQSANQQPVFCPSQWFCLNFICTMIIIIVIIIILFNQQLNGTKPVIHQYFLIPYVPMFSHR